MDVYRRELMEQPAALLAAANGIDGEAAVLAEFVARTARERVDKVIITGMGGSYYAATPLWLRLAAAGIASTHIDTAELVHTALQLVTPRSLLLVVSQSGETVEVLRLLERMRRPRLLVSVTNGRDNGLARAADYSFDTKAGAERSVSGKSYVASLLVLEAIGRSLTGLDVHPALWNAPIAVVRALLDSWAELEALLAEALVPCEPLYLLGRGPSLASASMGALALKEASRWPAEGMSAAQFRHGPLEIVRPGMGAILFAPRCETRPLILRLAEELVGYGASTVVVGPPLDDDSIPGTIEIPVPTLDPWLAPIGEIVPIQILSHVLATRLGHEPGHFARLAKVTRDE